MHYDFIEIKDLTSFLPYDNKIIECRYQLKDEKWIFFKGHQDKKFPSSFNMAQGWNKENSYFSIFIQKS